LAAVAGEWDELCDRSPAATPFQSAAWLGSWRDAYGRPDRSVLVLVRRDGMLVAGAALHAGRTGPWRTLTPLGAGVSDATDILVDPHGAPQAIDRLTAALVAEPGWDLLCCPESRPGAAFRGLAAQWPGWSWRATSSVCLEVPAGPLPEVLARIPRGTAGTLRKKFRKIDADGPVATIAPAAEAEEGIRELLRLHARQWRGRPINSEHLTPRFERHLVSAGAALVRQGRAVVVRYRRDDRPVAAELLVVSPHLVGAYLFGYDPALREQIDVAAMLVRQNLAVAHQLGRPTLSLLRGDEPYKHRWRPLAVPNDELVLVHPGTAAGAGYPVYRRARAAAGTLVRRLRRRS
jgi:CelD/BcsL family acetyltransferase involved in cellulose biosynthesis